MLVEDDPAAQIAQAVALARAQGRLVSSRRADDDPGSCGQSSCATWAWRGFDHAARALRIASLMHDIGKVAIPDSILLSPDPLSDEEFALVNDIPRSATSC